MRTYPRLILAVCACLAALLTPLASADELLFGSTLEIVAVDLCETDAILPEADTRALKPDFVLVDRLPVQRSGPTDYRAFDLYSAYWVPYPRSG